MDADWSRPFSSGGIHFTPEPPRGVPAKGAYPEPSARIPPAREIPKMTAITMEALTDQMTAGMRRISGPVGVEGEDGYRPGSEFEVGTEEEAKALVERRLARRLSAESRPEDDAAAEAASAAAAVESAPWRLQLTPEEYLKKYPGGGAHTAQAQAVIAKRAAASQAQVPALAPAAQQPAEAAAKKTA